MCSLLSGELRFQVSRCFIGAVVVLDNKHVDYSVAVAVDRVRVGPFAVERRLRRTVLLQIKVLDFENQIIVTL